MKDKKTRCWNIADDDELMKNYHDNEWGRPTHDDRDIFEALILEGAQAGLSWRTILNKRDNYRKAFDDFDVELVASYDEKKVEELLNNEGIVRNRLKIDSAIKNAKVFIEIQKEFGSFDKYIWGFVDGKVVENDRKESFDEMPVKTDLSDKIGKDLKKRGMSFVGSTIIYSMIQSIGIVNDHKKNCCQSWRASKLRY